MLQTSGVRPLVFCLRTPFSSAVQALLLHLAAAIPYPYASEDATTPPATLIALSGTLPTSTVATPDSTSLNIPVTAVPDAGDDDNDNSDENDDDGNAISRSKRPHKEPIPIFTKQCQCQLATAWYPCWATDSLQVSEATPGRNVETGKEEPKKQRRER